MPDFKFFWDDAFDRGARVDAVLAEIEGGNTQKESDEDER
jgi:ribosome-binding factor A